VLQHERRRGSGNVQGRTDNPPHLEGAGISGISKLFRLKGSYTIVVFVPVKMRIEIGSLGTHEFPRGYYAYTGSALGEDSLSLGGRIRRHLRRSKKKRWHIDHLLSGDNARVRAVIAAHTEKKMECELNRCLRDGLRAEIPVKGFGSSDCQGRCGSHLLYLGLNEDVVRKIARFYSEKVDEEVFVLDFR
jgi:Uri superfamily endonuclease